MNTGELYDLLGIPASADPEEVKAAYRLAARRFHPDANANPGSTEAFRQVADAYVSPGSSCSARWMPLRCWATRARSSGACSARHSVR